MNWRAYIVAPAFAVFIAGASYHRQQHDRQMAAALRTARLASGVGVGRTAVVTGATSGIGKACALLLAESGFNVVAIGRSEKRGAEMVKEMSALGRGKHEFVACDAFSLRNVAQTASAIRASHSPIDVLILSQGMATIQGFTPTQDGNDQKLTLHYWGRMALIHELLPVMRSAPDPRVISVLSGGVHGAYAGYRTDAELRNTYSIKNAADAAGFYNDLGLDALAVAESNGSVVMVHAAPGFVKTSWGTEMPWYLRGPIRALQLFGKEPSACAEAMCAPVFRSREQLLTQNAGKPGVVILGQHAEDASRTALHTPDARDSVWATTTEVLSRAGIKMA